SRLSLVCQTVWPTSPACAPTTSSICLAAVNRLPLRRDIGQSEWNVRFGSKADSEYVRAMSALPPERGHRLSAFGCPLCAKSRHRASAREGIGYSLMILVSGESERILCEFGDGLGCDPERLCDVGRSSRHAETIDPEGNALIADPTRPAESCGGFDGHARGYFGR